MTSVAERTPTDEPSTSEVFHSLHAIPEHKHEADGGSKLEHDLEKPIAANDFDERTVSDSPQENVPFKGADQESSGKAYLTVKSRV